MMKKRYFALSSMCDGNEYVYRMQEMMERISEKMQWKTAKDFQMQVYRRRNHKAESSKDHDDGRSTG